MLKQSASTEEDGAIADALRRCAAGDRAALKEIYDAEAGRLIVVARRILRRSDLAEEALQEAFLKIWRNAKSWRPDRGSARGWIYAVLRNQALTMLRKADREAPVEDVIRLADAAQPEPDPDAELRDLAATSRLRDCLMALDEAKRRSVLMAYLYGYSHGEIAGRLRAPLGTTKAWIRRGLAALRECLS